MARKRASRAARRQADATQPKGAAPGRTGRALPLPLRPAHVGFHWRIWAAEGTATGVLVLGGLSAACLDFGRGSAVAQCLPSHSARLLLTGLLFSGCNSLLAVSPLGRLSGAHLNPAVTLAFRALGRVGGHDLTGYLIAQLAGAVAAALRLLWGDVADSIGGAVTEPQSRCRRPSPSRRR